jgi:hypothetical protein
MGQRGSVSSCRDGLHVGVRFLLLRAPWSPADKDSDYYLALKHFSRASEIMTDPAHLDASKNTRVWWGVQMVGLASSLVWCFEVWYAQELTILLDKSQAASAYAATKREFGAG